MSTSPGTLPIHSLAEAYLYVMVTPCASCETGPLAADESRVQHDATARVLTIPVRCRKCGAEANLGFSTSGIEPDLLNRTAPGTPDILNPTDDPSAVIDIAGWLTLYSVIADAASEATNPAEARRFKLEAAQCLDEALKFYEDDNDLPPPEAFFNARSQRQFRDRPASFTRSRLIELRSNLPTSRSSDMSSDSSPELKKGRWWPWRDK